MDIFPPKSSLSEAEYGKGTALTDKHILPFLGGLTVQQAIKEKRLFTIDYHDTVLPFVEKVNSSNGAQYQTYAPRTIFFLDKGALLKPVAIELSLPPKQKGGPANNRVFTPGPEDTNRKFWLLAKIHAACIDSNYHQVLSHFTFTHAVMETFVISSYRQLSELHPMRTLMKPYFKDTLSIDSAARSVLISAGGMIEELFVMGKYEFELGAVGYGAFWRFDKQALPEDLKARGMAEPADSSYPGRVKLVIEDYPYAKDGLELWDAIESYVESYVNIYYKDDQAVKNDTEIQVWWKEVRTVGNADIADGWLELNSKKNLVRIICTFGWIGRPNHAALNFEQWVYRGYPLNKPSTTRRPIPEVGTEDYKQLQDNPEKYLLSTVASADQAIEVMSVLELLATHAVDEEYIGTRHDTNWTGVPEVQKAFRSFAGKIEEARVNILERTKTPNCTTEAAWPKFHTHCSSQSRIRAASLAWGRVPNSVSI